MKIFSLALKVVALATMLAVIYMDIKTFRLKNELRGSKEGQTRYETRQSVSCFLFCVACILTLIGVFLGNMAK